MATRNVSVVDPFQPARLAFQWAAPGQTSRQKTWRSHTLTELSELAELAKRLRKYPPGMESMLSDRVTETT